MATRPPSKRWYRLSSALVVVGLLAAGAWWFYATSRVYDAVEEFQRLPPFGGQVAIHDPGPHTFWIEGACLSCHGNDPAEYRAVATIEIDGPDGRPVPLRTASRRVYNTSRREGRSLWRFDAARPGTYRVAFDLDTNREGWENVVPDNIAIGEGDGLPVGIVRPMALIAGLGIALGALIAVVTAVRRRRYYDIPFDERT